MNYDFLKDVKYDLDYFLKQAIIARHNSIILKNNANRVFKDQQAEKHGLFFLYTAFEELQKAIFCLFVHRGFMNKEQILPIFWKHESKIILFEKIFRSSKGLSIYNNEFSLDGILLKNLDFKTIIAENEIFGKNYMEKRNECLYSRPDENGYYSPSVKSNIDKEKERLNDEMSALNGLFEIIWMYDFNGHIDGFQYYKLTPKDKPEKHNITFVGGELIERKDFRPKWVDELGKELDSKS
jgi:AbiV family abortive infection protein